MLLLLLSVSSGIVSAAALAGAHALGWHGEIVALVCGVLGTTIGYVVIGYATQDK